MMNGTKIFNHLMATLPDSIKERSELLADFMSITPEASQIWTDAAILLRTLQEHEQQIKKYQLELSLSDTSVSKVVIDSILQSKKKKNQ